MPSRRLVCAKIRVSDADAIASDIQILNGTGVELGDGQEVEHVGWQRFGSREAERQQMNAPIVPMIDGQNGTG